MEWEEYAASMQAQFGSCGYDDPLANLQNLRQVSTLQQ